jgi:hypothetical protein
MGPAPLRVDRSAVGRGAAVRGRCWSGGGRCWSGGGRCWSGGGRRWSRRSCLDGSRGVRQAGHRGAVAGGKGEDQRGDEEDARANRGHLAQEAARPAAAEHRSAASSSEGEPHPRVLARLQQNHEDEKDADEDVDDGDERDEHVRSLPFSFGMRSWECCSWTCAFATGCAPRLFLPASRETRGYRRAAQSSRTRTSTSSPPQAQALAALTILEKSSALRLAPPTRAPSMSGWDMRSAALSGLTEPPYWMRTPAASG